MLFLAFASYLLGAVPFGFLIGKINGIDIRQQGSGNIGATNVFRCVGKAWGITAFLMDFAKGLAASIAIPYAGTLYGLPPCNREHILLLGFLAIVGHNWPIFLKFKGGKGIATTVGVLAGVAPLTIGPGLAAWFVCFVASRYVSFASIAGCIAVGASSWLFYNDASRDTGWLVPAVLTLLAGMGIWRHRSNIQRLLNGTENRFDFSKRKKNTDDDSP